jgi:phenylacetate-CoA ligase
MEAAPREALLDVQQKRLKALVQRLNETVPFYRAALAARSIAPDDVTVEAVRHLPLTTRDDLRDQHPFGLLSVPEKQVVRLHATSGTKGKPTLVAYTAEDLHHWADICARMLTAAGCRKRDTWYIASGYGLFTGGLGAHYGAERIGARVVPASSGNTARLIQLMADVRPDGIHCIPSYMLRIAEVADAAGVDPVNLGLRFGSFGGEPWSESLRRRIEEQFGLKACDVYGLSEGFGPGVAYECEARDGLHVCEDHFLIEIVDPATGEPVPDGVEGELVLTTLTKQAMPLLRYRTRDLTRFLPGRCACGRTLRRIARLTGRSDDMVTVRGVNLFPSEVEALLLRFPEVSPVHRLVLERTGSMDALRLEAELTRPAAPDDPATAALTQRIGQRLREALSLTVVVHLLGPGTLPRSEGKAERLVDLRPR